jgi:hypothetical protein
MSNFSCIRLAGSLGDPVTYLNYPSHTTGVWRQPMSRSPNDRHNITRDMRRVILVSYRIKAAGDARSFLHRKGEIRQSVTRVRCGAWGANHDASYVVQASCRYNRLELAISSRSGCHRNATISAPPWSRPLPGGVTQGRLAVLEHQAVVGACQVGLALGQPLTFPSLRPHPNLKG